MRGKEVLTATGTGLWRWDSATGTITLDAIAAGLLGLPPEPVTAGESVVRARFHPVDFVELHTIAALAAAEGTIAEALLRVVLDDGTTPRTVRLRLVPATPPESSGTVVAPLIGLVSEAPVPPSGAAPAPAPFTEPAEDAAESAGASAEGAAGRAPVVQTSVVQTSVTGDWRRSREAFLLDAGRALAEARTTSEVLRVTSTLSMPGFSPDGMGVFGVEGDRLTVVGHHGQPAGAERPFRDMPLNTAYPAAEVVRTGRAVYLSSPEEYRRRFPATWPLAEPFGRRSWAFLPLIEGGRTIGVWLAAFGHRVAFTPDERSVLTTVAQMLAQALSRAHVHDSERELNDDLQHTLRPARRLGVPGLVVAGRYVPTGGGLQMGGDWYDLIPLPSGRTALVIGDVQGHDVRAAGIMAQLRIALRAYAAEGHRPGAVLARASRFLAGMDDGGHEPADDRFATCLYVAADPLGGTLEIARAGHHDPVVRLTDGTVLVRPTAGGPPLGVVPDPDYPTTRMPLEPGETLLLCTDGLIEAGGHDLETGWERLLEVLRAHPVASLEKLADALVQTACGPHSHRGAGPPANRREDDIALLLLRREESRDRGDGASQRVTVRRTALTVAQSEPDRIAEARRRLRELLYDWTAGEQVEGAVLLLSELLTNALIHTDEDASVTVELTGDHGSRRLRLEVADRSDELPRLRRPGELASRGRGLLLLENLADSWGVAPRGEGKSTWFELREGSGRRGGT